MNREWRIKPHDPDRVQSLCRTLRVPAILAQLLDSRGLGNPDVARQFLDPRLNDLRGPELLPGATQAAEIVQRAIAERKKIVIYGDYDVDGMAATSILWQCLKLLGGNVGFYVPNRMEEGYGLNDEALKSLKEQGADLVITVDCGIASVAEAETARALGLQLVISDHHRMADRLPDAAALVHPALPGSNYPFAGLSGSGVAFKLAWAICQQASQATRVSEPMRLFLLQAVGLAALGTVADVVPLVDENRILVRHGLKSLKERPLPGLAQLIRVAKLDDKPALDSEDIAFSLAPRLNAAGRLGQAQLGVELLTTSSAERATTLAEYIDELNNSRQSLEQSIYLAANKQAQRMIEAQLDSALVLADHGWHPGVIGIVAGRLAEKYRRPVLVISLDELGIKPGVGSGRSVPGFDLHQALESCRQHLVGFGGHAAAAGLKIDERRLEHFRNEFCEAVSSTWQPSDGDGELVIDAEVPLAALTLDVVSHIDRLGPFGHGNRRPVFCASGVVLSEPARRIGGGGRHLALKLSQHGVGMRAVSFGNGDWADSLPSGDEPLHISFRPIINAFRGRRTVELQVEDWRPAHAPSIHGGAA